MGGHRPGGRGGGGCHPALARCVRDRGDEPANNPKYYVCASARELLDRGFAFVKDGYDEEPELHFSVDMGPDPNIETVERFLEPFTAARRN